MQAREKLDFNATLTYRYRLNVTDKNNKNVGMSGGPESIIEPKTVFGLLKSFVDMKKSFEDFKKENALPDNTPIYIHVKGTLGSEEFDYEFDNLDDCKKLFQNIAAKDSGKVPTTFNIAEGVINNPVADKQATTNIVANICDENAVLIKLLKLTEHYLAKKDLDPAKKAIFDNLKATLKTPLATTAERITKFTDALKNADKTIINHHRTADWKRYLANVFSILAIVPALVRAYNSHSQYGSYSFWKAGSAQAIEGMDKVLQTVKLKL